MLKTEILVSVTCDDCGLCRAVMVPPQSNLKIARTLASQQLRTAGWYISKSTDKCAKCAVTLLSQKIVPSS